MKRQKRLPVPFLTLTDVDLRSMAEHFSSLADEVMKGLVVEERARQKQYTTLTGKALERKVQEQLADRLSGHAHYDLTLSDGSMSGTSWDELWLKADLPEVRVISMRAEGLRTKLALKLSVGGSSPWGNSLDVESDNDEEFQRELGYFTDLFWRRRAIGRYRVSTSSWTGRLLWYVLPPVVAVLVLFRFYYIPNWDSTTSLADNVQATFWLFILAGSLLSPAAAWLQGKVAGRVSVEGVGPDQGLRNLAAVIGVGLLGSAIWSAVTLAFQL